MKETGIIMQPESIRATLDRRKTQTRRVIKSNRSLEFDGCEPPWPTAEDQYGDAFRIACPYGGPGDRLYLKENYAFAEGYDDCSPSSVKEAAEERYADYWPHVWYAADEDNWDRTINGGISGIRGRQRPSIFMPKKLARIWMEITEVRAERLQDISEEDCYEEGCRDEDRAVVSAWCIGGEIVEAYEPIQDVFHTLWDSINAERGYPWDSNPWVWVVTYKLLEVNHGH